MRAKIVLLLLGLLAMLASHQDARSATLCRGIGFDGDIVFPRAGGKFTGLWLDSTFPTVRATPGAGKVAWWWASDGFDWSLNWAFCSDVTLRAKCQDPIAIADLSAALGARDRMAALEAVLAKHGNLSMTSGPALLTWCPHWSEIVSSMPPRPVYLVAKLGTNTTRPAFKFIPATATSAPAREKSSSSRATVGSRCDCRTRVIEGSTLLCALEEQPTHVAICAKQ